MKSPEFNLTSISMLYQQRWDEFMDYFNGIKCIWFHNGKALCSDAGYLVKTEGDHSTADLFDCTGVLYDLLFWFQSGLGQEFWGTKV